MTVQLARRFRVDVSTDNATWIPLRGINDLNPTIKNTTQTSDDYDTNGFTSIEKTAISWSLVIKALRKTTSGVFDPGQELVRQAQLQFGDPARVYVRWYDRNGAAEAFTGKAVVEYTASKTGVDDLDEVSITLTGDGILTAITNPAIGTNVPVISSITPSGVGTAGAVAIYGAGFTGATSVKFATYNATSYSVQSDGLIIAVLPTGGGAGTVSVTVVTGYGTSAGVNYTRAA